MSPEGVKDFYTFELIFQLPLGSRICDGAELINVNWRLQQQQRDPRHRTKCHHNGVPCRHGHCHCRV